MTAPTTPFPDFENPPVVEVALSVQFDSLENLRTPQLGLLWREFQAEFPRTEEYPALDPVFERFGLRPTAPDAPSFQMLTSPPIPRCWFLNREGTELIQVQQDRFIHNWRKTGESGSYPRYERVRARFESELVRFREFLLTQRIGELIPNQCEVTYVNHVESGEGWQHHGQIGDVLSVFGQPQRIDFLSIPEDGRVSLRYVMRNDADETLGRLHISMAPVFRRSDDSPMFMLTLTARGRPSDASTKGVIEFLDIGREWVVRGFASVTTSKMHTIWRRKQ